MPRFIKDKIYYTPERNIFLYDGVSGKVLFGESIVSSTTEVAFLAPINPAVLETIGFKLDKFCYWTYNTIKIEYCLQSQVYMFGDTQIPDFTILKSICDKEGIYIDFNINLLNAFSS